MPVSMKGGSDSRNARPEPKPVPPFYAPLCIPVNRSFSTVSSYIWPNSSKIGRRSFSSRLRGICPTNSLTASASFIGTPTMCACGGCCRCVTGPLCGSGGPPDSAREIGPFVSVVMVACSADEPHRHNVNTIRTRPVFAVPGPPSNSLAK